MAVSAVGSPASGYKLIKTTYITSGSGTFTAQAETQAARIICIGSGGGGGGGSGRPSGGGGGAYAESFLTSRSSIDGVSYSVGSGGGGGTSGNGSDGGSTTWGSTVIVADGGKAGHGGSRGQDRNDGLASSSTGDIKLNGDSSTCVSTFYHGAGNPGYSMGSHGGRPGNSRWGGGTNFNPSVTGLNPHGYGGGGSGGNTTGGTGSGGLIVVYEYAKIWSS